MYMYYNNAVLQKMTLETVYWLYWNVMSAVLNQEQRKQCEKYFGFDYCVWETFVIKPNPLLD